MTLTAPARGSWTTPRFSIDTLNDSWNSWMASGAVSMAWGTASRAIYVPIRVPRRVVVVSLGYAAHTTATGNIDVGLYDQAGARLVSTGSTAKSATAAVIPIDVADTTIGPGLYYLGLNNDTTTDTFIGDTADTAPNLAARGVLSEALGSVTLPNPASWAVDQTLAVCPTIVAFLNAVVT